MNRIQKIFQNRSEKVIPFLTAGYPTKESAVEMVMAAEQAGAAMVELGMPFSDPLADGLIIQEASQIAIENGVNIKWILETVSNIRMQSEMPLVLMGYINPIIKYGVDKFIIDCKNAGVDGLIIPDLPPEEAEEIVKMAQNVGICIILLVAPNTSDERIQEISQMVGVLIYCVAILGITGGQGANENELKKYLKRVEKFSSCPFVVGFGIKERVDVIEINKMAHGAVVGSAIIEQLKNSDEPVKTIGDYIKKLTRGTE
ncbi:MAG: tryptophan synthase subunit alpha [Candidatus Marinimicrobia bacterium]|nr:tryptophan synthase subunit alpha [Candidatus Neomarinimicrobiota bacterium]